MPRSSGPAVLGGECFQRSKLFQKEVVELALPADDGVHELVTSMPSCHGMRRKQVQPAGLKDDLVVDFGGVHDELDAEAKGAAHDALEEVGRDVVFFFFFFLWRGRPRRWSGRKRTMLPPYRRGRGG